MHSLVYQNYYNYIFINLYKYFRMLIWYIKQFYNFSHYIYAYINTIKVQKLIKNNDINYLVKPYLNLFSSLDYLNILDIFFYCFKYKNLDFLVKYIKLLFKNVNFFKHQYLLFFLRYIFKCFNTTLFNNFNVLGIFMKFHGKIAKAGNSRKKRYTLQYNTISTAYNKNYLIDKFQITTFTGVVGCTVILSFK